MDGEIIMGKTRNFGDIIRRKMDNDPELAARVEEHAVDRYIGTEIYELRKRLGLTQTQLAKKIGSHQSVIARLEDADYEGHTLSMLKKIAAATDTRYRGGFYAKPTPVESMVTPEVTGQSIRLPDIEWNSELKFEVACLDG